jgi:hypothetical protein
MRSPLNLQRAAKLPDKLQCLRLVHIREPDQQPFCSGLPVAELKAHDAAKLTGERRDRGAA